MLEIKETENYRRWFRSLRDPRAQKRILTRLVRLIQGNAGDVRSIGEGVSELRIDYGPGYRVYFVRRGSSLVILLGGGDKRTQARDIKTALQLSVEVKQTP
ncbi:MAG TPA: type II toxin-antitoxin system RelE/ParE family toxin [Rhizomicrobium sp.]